MILTNRQIGDISEVLTSIGQKEGIDPVIGVKIARNNNELIRLNDPVVKQRTKIVEKYGKRDSNGKLVSRGNSVPIENPEAYNAEHEKLMNAECDVNIILFSMEDIETMSPTPNQIMQLLPIMKE